MDASQILARLESALALKNDRALADYLGVSPSVISTWKGRRIGDWELIFEKCDTVDLNWVVRGDLSQNENKISELRMLRERVAQLEEQNREFLSIIKNLSAK